VIGDYLVVSLRLIGDYLVVSLRLIVFGARDRFRERAEKQKI